MPVRLLIIVLLAVLPIAVSSGREWSDATGKFEAELEDCDVILRLPSGELATIRFSSLTERDRTFVLEELRRARRDAPEVLPEIAASLGKHVAKLQHQFAAHASRDEIEKTLNSIRAADPTFKQLKPIVKALLDSTDVDALIHNREKRAALSSGLAIVDEFKLVDAWLIENLLSLEEEYPRELLMPTSLGDRERIGGVRPYRHLIGLLAGMTARDPRVKALFDTRIESLVSDPNPETRAVAALELSGAKPLSDRVVPPLVNALKSDVSSLVQDAAGYSLGGFENNAHGAVQSLIEKLEQDGDRDIYLTALVEGYRDSPLLRNLARRRLEAYRSSNGSIHIPCAVLMYNGQDNAWAIAGLLDACEISLKRQQRDSFEMLREALLANGRIDQRALRFFERQAREGPEWARVACDTAAKQVAANIRAAK